ncbi:MAG: GtrA family protein [Nitrospirae bacterium]|nr:MAG: GtrA family protein [Nitrospirota bacterium]
MRRLLRFLAAGATAAATQTLLLYLLTEVAGLWYLWASSVAFGAGVVVSFLLQKLWTFEDRDLRRLPAQAAAYVALAVVNLGVNDGLMLLLVDRLGVHYLVAQVAAAAAVAAETFTVYRLWLFRRRA